MKSTRKPGSRLFSGQGLPLFIMILSIVSFILWLADLITAGEILNQIDVKLIFVFGIGLTAATILIWIIFKNNNSVILSLENSIQAIKKQKDDQEQIAQMIADGNFSFAIQSVSETDQLSNNLIKIRNSLNLLESQNDGEHDNHAALLSGGFYKILNNQQVAVKKETDQKEFYGAILDALPYSLLVSDSDFKYKYVNKSMANYLLAKGIITERELAIGMDCSVSGSNMCGNENCARRLLIEKGLNTTNFEARGKYYKEDIAFLKDKNGKNTTDVLELTLDQTPVMSVSAYNQKEVDRLLHNLICLANGNLNFDLDVEEPDEFTQDAYQQFNSIRGNMIQVKNSISSLIENTTWIIKEIIDGNLSARADETKFNGSWKTLISGMNTILEKIKQPLDEVIAVMSGVSNGNLHIAIEGEYHGEFNQLKVSVNQTKEYLNWITNRIKQITGEISQGNLDLGSIDRFEGDFSDISDALNSIVATLNELLSEINDSAEQVSSGADQVSGGSQLLAQGSTEQASTIEELTASIAEIALQTKNNARNANEAQRLSKNAKLGAENGNMQMSAMQHSMREINQSSMDISKIIKVIDDIAFQTNILALNAAVEAVRAGQHGKGFAVVAQEVRTLAARSADAAKETTILIEGSINKVKRGTEIADETATALLSMVDGIGKVTDLVGNIAIASNEQASEIAQINHGIEQVAQVVHQNSATAEESAAASEELSGQAELLKNKLHRFRLRDNV
nr:methyl-accepting chemotaxis protein [uncultured Acetobacterium sp.]